VDSTICPTYGPAKSGTAFGDTLVRGYHPLLATVREPGPPGEVLHTRLRRGNAASGQGGGHFLSAPGQRGSGPRAGRELIVPAGFEDLLRTTGGRQPLPRFAERERHRLQLSRSRPPTLS